MNKKIIKSTIAWIALNSSIFLLLYLWLMHGAAWAGNILCFLIFVNLFLTGFLWICTLIWDSTSKLKVYEEYFQRKIPTALWLIPDSVCILILAAAGHFVLATACLLQTLTEASMEYEYRQIRKEPIHELPKI